MLQVKTELDVSPLLVCVVIVNWNGKSLLAKCLSTLYANTDSSKCKVVVVDNASSDGSVELVKQHYPQVALIENSANKGFAIANNQGIRYGLEQEAKYILLLNNDVEIIGETWLDDFLEVFKSDCTIGIVGCKLLYPDGTIQHAGGFITKHSIAHRGSHEKDMGQYDKVESVDYVTGAALMIKAEAVRRIGILDEGFTPLYYEDTDWCLRPIFAGYRVVYSPKPALIHTSAVSSGKLNRDKKRLYARRSLLRFYLLNFPSKDIANFVLISELKEAIRCLIVKSSGKLPFTFTSDASERTRFLLRVWWAIIRDLKGIMYLRRQRFMHGAKLHFR